MSTETVVLTKEAIRAAMPLCAVWEPAPTARAATGRPVGYQPPCALCGALSVWVPTQPDKRPDVAREMGLCQSCKDAVYPPIPVGTFAVRWTEDKYVMDTRAQGKAQAAVTKAMAGTRKRPGLASEYTAEDGMVVYRKAR